MKKIIFILLILIINIFAAENGGEPFAFIKNGVDAEAIGLGQAVTGYPYIENANFYNPATLAFYSDRKISLSINQPYSEIKDLKYYTLNSNFSLTTFSKLAFFVESFNIDNIREATTGDPTINNLLTGNTFDENELLFITSFAHKFILHQNIAYGINLKILKQKIYNYSDLLVSSDIGFIYKKKVFNFGATIGNLYSTKLQLLNKKEKLPIFIKLGFSTTFIPAFTLTTDLNLQEKKSVNSYFGIKYNYNMILSFYSGYNNETNLFTLGFGTYFKNFKVNYTASYNKYLNLGHRITLTLKY